MIKPTREDITIYQGATYFRRYTWTPDDPAVPQDLTGAAIRMQVRETKNSDVTLLDLSTAGAGVTITDGPAGKFTVRAEASQTDALSFSRGVYDLEIRMPDSTVIRMVEGDVILSRQVTRTP